MGPGTTKVNLAELPDDALVLRSQEGDEKAANVLYRRYWPVACAIAAEGSVGCDWDQLYGDVFLACLRPGRFDPARGRFRAYFGRAMANEVRRFHHRRRRSPGLLTDSIERRAEAAAGSGHPPELQPLDGPDEPDEQQLDLREAVATVVAGWEAATFRRRERARWAAIARLLYLDGCSYAEAAAELGVPVKTIHNCLSRHINPAICDHMSRPDRPDPFGGRT